MMRAILADSGALLALIDRRDTNYVAASKFAQTLQKANVFVPETVFIETMTLVKARLGSSAAVELGNRLMKSALFLTVQLTEEDRSDTWQIFSRYQDKAWSYTDCSILALSRRLQIYEVFGFDHHLEQMPELARVPAA